VTDVAHALPLPRREDNDVNAICRLRSIVREYGQDMVEYAALVALIALTAVVGSRLAGGSVSSVAADLLARLA
jgi:Flp pilus assembly pilin Flp